MALNNFIIGLSKTTFLECTQTWYSKMKIRYQKNKNWCSFEFDVAFGIGLELCKTTMS